EHLISEDLMTDSGMLAIKIAKENGSWDRLNEVDNLVLPADLLKAFNKNKLAKSNWEKFSKSVKQGILQWLLSAKKTETRQKRISEIVSLAEKNLKANQYVKK
ncbi:MAG: YdeI/OmpD-associated family protein, partial [Prolixibacteraceae bacterium]|nr:YdeI/OmpD-associated family protein [Prolixibacteraceae bacterium]